MAERTKAEQPDWLTPIATTSGRLKNEFRYDAWRQTAPSGETDYTLGGGKGVELIAAPRLQVMLGLPPYVLHRPSGPADGFGDLPLMMKFRLASAGRNDGNYLVTLLLNATVPTGSQTAGVHPAVLSPGIALGKGWRRFDVQSTFSASLPSGSTQTLGRQFLSNVALQYRASWKLWPELEINSTSFLAGKNAGQTQTYLTPGLGFGRVQLRKPLSFSVGTGLQIAATRFHTYNHRWMVSVRLSF
jgi:hypothetical protein